MVQEVVNNGESQNGNSKVVTFSALKPQLFVKAPKGCLLLSRFLLNTECFRDGEAELPLEFPDGTTPVTFRVCIYDSSTDSKVGVGSLMKKATVPPLPAGSLYMEEVHAKDR